MDKIGIGPLSYIGNQLGSLPWEGCAGGLPGIYFVVGQLWPLLAGVMVPELANHTASRNSGDFGGRDSKSVPKDVAARYWGLPVGRFLVFSEYFDREVAFGAEGNSQGFHRSSLQFPFPYEEANRNAGRREIEGFAVDTLAAALERDGDHHDHVGVNFVVLVDVKDPGTKVDGVVLAVPVEGIFVLD